MTILPLFIVINSLSWAREIIDGNKCDQMTTQRTMLLCVGDEYKQTDGELNQRYQTIMHGLKAQAKTLLKNAEKAWITYRDAHCHAVRQRYQGGSVMSLVEVACLNNITKARIHVLNMTYQQP